MDKVYEQFTEYSLQRGMTHKKEYPTSLDKYKYKQQDTLLLWPV